MLLAEDDTGAPTWSTSPMTNSTTRAHSVQWRHSLEAGHHAIN